MLAAVDPNRPGHYPTCPFLYLTGYYCPGCGSLRALHDLVAHGDLAAALRRNPLTVVMIPFVMAAWLLWALRLAGLTTWTPTRIRPAWIWAYLVLLVVYWVARNVPGWTWLSPA